MRTRSHYQTKGNLWLLFLILPFVWFAVAGQGLHSHGAWNEARSLVAPHFRHAAHGKTAHQSHLHSQAPRQNSEFCAACQWLALAFTATAAGSWAFVAFSAAIYAVSVSRGIARQPVKFRGRGPPMFGFDT